MASTPPNTSMRSPAGVPPGGNGIYVAVAAALLLGIAGVVYWKTSQRPPAAPIPVSPVADAGSVPTSRATRNADDEIPLPPPVEDAGSDSGDGTKTTSVKHESLCESRLCFGMSNSELESQLAFRVRQAKRCYNAALAQDNTLKGKLALRVRVGALGQVCRATVVNDDIGNAPLANCVANTFRGANFPPPKGGCLDVDVPVNFVPGQ